MATPWQLVLASIYVLMIPIIKANLVVLQQVDSSVLPLMISSKKRSAIFMFSTFKKIMFMSF